MSSEEECGRAFTIPLDEKLHGIKVPSLTEDAIIKKCFRNASSKLIKYGLGIQCRFFLMRQVIVRLLSSVSQPVDAMLCASSVYITSRGECLQCVMNYFTPNSGSQDSC
jgi:hypothetical protein